MSNDELWITEHYTGYEALTRDEQLAKDFKTILWYLNQRINIEKRDKLEVYNEFNELLKIEIMKQGESNND